MGLRKLHFAQIHGLSGDAVTDPNLQTESTLSPHRGRVCRPRISVLGEEGEGLPRSVYADCPSHLGDRGDGASG